ncbi:hypothetical protein GCM10008955_11370 [Deinococcus malanensis]|uniref:Uncharacterized protein n=2 Tax=Deinococcus malanensis TaxID=1706855 RepID=A0ABQ2ES44_9DEIO|nr:hypothetical protein GCM10008955_11370 [Deinococcus malanensis]
MPSWELTDGLNAADASHAAGSHGFCRGPGGRRLDLTRGRPGARRTAALALATPTLASFAFFLGLLLATGWNELRGTDTGWYDTYRTPLGGGYYITRIDTSSSTPFLETPGGRQPPGAVTRLGCAGRLVAVELTPHEQTPGYVLIGPGKRLRPFQAQAALERAAGQPVTWGRELAWGKDLEETASCAPRVGWADHLVGGALTATPPLLTFGALAWRIRTVRRRPPLNPGVSAADGAPPAP